mgnify:FL=1
MIKSENAADILREKLQQGKVKFVFRKKDGSRRPAVGTTNLDIIPQDLWPKGMDGDEPKPQNDSLVTYFDCEKGAWRACKAENILEIEGEEVEV